MALSPLDLCNVCQDDIDYSIDTVYLFTWNPNKKLMPDNDQYLLKWETMICKILKQFTRCMKWYCIMPEVSDMGRVHCHGWFVIGDKIKWLKSIKPTLQMHGHCKFNKLRHVNGFNYYVKDIDVASNYFSDYYPYCHYNNEDIIKKIRQKYLEKSQSYRKIDITTLLNVKQ